MMSDNDIRKKFQSKLSGFEAPVPVDGWESVERSLKAAAVARTLSRRGWWYAGSAAAVLLLIVGSILFMRNPLPQPEVMVSESVSATPATPDTRTGALRESDPSSEVDASPSKDRQLPDGKKGDTIQGRKAQSVRLAAPGGILTAWMNRKGLNIKSVKEKAASEEIRLPANAGEADTGQYGKDLFAEETIIVGGDHNPLFAGGIANGKRGTETLLLAVNGRGGLTGYQQTVNSPMTLRSASVATENKYPVETSKAQFLTENVAGNVSEMEHDQPISFGITVSKYLSDDLSLETGLVYSYLHSKTRNTNDNFQVAEVQKLHYLGIPINVNYNILSLHKLNIYASVGGMVEKDLSGEYKRMKEGQSVNLNNPSEESTVMEIDKISQKNPQFSVNAGVGASYPIYDRLRLYGKIGGAYYFDAKNEYKTIYSDRKIVLDLNVGLRYEF